MLLNKKLAAMAIGLGLLTMADVSTARGAVITSGTYTGTPGTDFGGGTGDAGGSGYLFDSGANAITGGTFTGGRGGDSAGANLFNLAGDGGDGVQEDLSGSLTITGGSFTGAAGGNASGATAANLGGDGGDALEVYNAVSATVAGGTFAVGAGGTPGGSTGYSFYTYAGGQITLVGTFQNAPVSPVTNGSGSFTGTLADNSTPATYTYDANGGTILFTSAGVPEPASLGLLGLAGAAVLGRRRRRNC